MIKSIPPSIAFLKFNAESARDSARNTLQFNRLLGHVRLGEKLFPTGTLTEKPRAKIKRLAFSCLVLFLPLLSFGQKGGLPLNLSFFNESTAIPFTGFLTTPVHPGVQLGTEFNYKRKPRSRLFQTANVSYFYHRHLAQGIGLSSEVGYEYSTRSGLALTGLLGIGYTHTFATSEEFTFSDGEYVKKPDKGNPRMTPSFAIDLGYYLKPKSEVSPKVFIRYQAWAEFPYSPGFIPVMTHVNLHVGLKFFLQKSRK